MTQSHELDDLFADDFSETSEFVSDELTAWESSLPETEVGGGLPNLIDSCLVKFYRRNIVIMNQENTKRLHSAFPPLYRGLKLSDSESCMSRGFECGDGWFDLIFQLSTNIVSDFSHLDVEATGVKQKWGSLSYRVNIYDNDKLDQTIDNARLIAQKVCEHCGKNNAQLYVCGGGYYIVLCENCSENYKWPCLTYKEHVDSRKNKTPVWKMLEKESK